MFGSKLSLYCVKLCKNKLKLFWDFVGGFVRLYKNTSILVVNRLNYSLRVSRLFML